MKKTLIALTALLASFSIAQAQTPASDASPKPAHSDTSFFSQDPDRVIIMVPPTEGAIDEKLKNTLDKNPSWTTLSDYSTNGTASNLKRVSIPRDEACSIYKIKINPIKFLTFVQTVSYSLKTPVNQMQLQFHPIKKTFSCSHHQL